MVCDDCCACRSNSSSVPGATLGVAPGRGVAAGVAGAAIQKRVVQNFEKPRFDPEFAHFKAIKCTTGFHERFLDEIFGFVLAARETASQAVSASSIGRSRTWT